MTRSKIVSKDLSMSEKAANTSGWTTNLTVKSQKVIIGKSADDEKQSHQLVKLKAKMNDNDLSMS
jgi:hypothetical protein